MVELKKGETLGTRITLERGSLEAKRKRNKINYREKGITLIALVVTIIILLILAGVTVSLVVGQNGLLQRAQTASNTMANATANELTQMGKYANEVDELTAGFISGESQQGGGSGTETNLEVEKIEAVNGHTALQTVDYTPATATTNDSVTIPGANNGGVADQTFSQTSIGAIGDGKVSWYVLSADENGVNLVSSPTKQKVQFKDAEGYDNCLYYLNEIATKLFANESAGVTADRVHALRLSDIRDAAEGMNGGSWSFDTTFLGGASKSSIVSTLGGSKTYTSNTKYPRIYKADSNGAVTANNPMYDEGTSGTGIPMSNDRVESSSSASSLTINSTVCWYNSADACKGNLGTFGTSGIGGELFKSGGTNFWLASRCVRAISSRAIFSLRCVYSGYLNYNYLASSDGYTYDPSYALRVVVSVPGSRVNIGADGTVTLK